MARAASPRIYKQQNNPDEQHEASGHAFKMECALSLHLRKTATSLHPQ